jgi:transposase-like protein
VCDPTLYVWLRGHKVDVGRPPGLTTDEREELRCLKHETRLLGEARETMRETYERRRTATGLE